MSVINKALSELDKRENNSEYKKYTPRKKGNYFTVSLVAISVALLALIAFYYIYSSYASKNNANLVKQENVQESSQSLENKPEPQVIAENKTTDEKVNADANNLAENKSEVVANDPQNEDDSNIDLAIQAELDNNNQESSIVTEDITISEHSAKKETQKKETPNGKDSVKNVSYPEKVDISDMAKDSSSEEEDINAPENFYIEAEPEPVYKETKPVSTMKVKEKKLSATEEIELYRKEANSAMLRGDNDSAISSLESLLNRAPRDSKAREKLASLYYAKGRNLDAIKLLDRGILLSPSHYDYRLYLSRIYVDMEQTNQAIKVLKQGNPPVQGNIDYYATLANISREVGDYATASDAYRKLASNERKDGKWFLGLGICKEEQGQPNEALDAYKKARALYLSGSSKSFVESRIQVLGGK